eukprot:2061106-Amphidinium_carterae.1
MDAQRKSDFRLQFSMDPSILILVGCCPMRLKSCAVQSPQDLNNAQHNLWRAGAEGHQCQVGNLAIVYHNTSRNPPVKDPPVELEMQRAHHNVSK